MSNETISLRLPASAEYGRIIRAAAANLATRLGWQAVDIDSLRLAIDEALSVLGCSKASGGSDATSDACELEIDFVIIENGIDLQIEAIGAAMPPIPTERIDRFQRLAAPGFATASVDAATHQVRIVKHV